MSVPSNPLSSYRTYAYHQMLLVCDSTSAADALSDKTDLLSFQHGSFAGRFAPKGIADGNYITLIDGISDSNFFITSSKWATVISPGEVSGDRQSSSSTTVALDGEMEIFEPKGAKFIKVLSDACDALNSDPGGLIFILKTIFVGHRDDGTTDMITTVRPLRFIMYDIVALFDSTGSKYVLSFVGLANGVSKLPQVSKIAEGMHFSVKKAYKLEDAIKALETKINTDYELFKAFVQKDFKEKGIDIDVNTDFRPVEYKFVLDDTYKTYSVGDNEKIRSANKTGGDPVLSFSKGDGIEEILDRILKSSNDVMAEVTGEKKKFIYKVVSEMKSTKDKITMLYSIQRYEAVTNPIAEFTSNNQMSPPAGQVLELFYIFTGRNVDIKEFNMKMEMGMAFFQTLTTSNTVPSQAEDRWGMSSDIAAGSGGAITKFSGTGKRRTGTPLYLGSSPAVSTVRNTQNPIVSASFQSMLDRFASYENIEATVTIHGNPQLMDEMLIEVDDGTSEAPIADATVNPQWQSVPTLMKVHVKMPANPNDPATEYEDFWYTGYYSIFSVNNAFSDGTFTQEIEVFSIPISDETATLTDSSLAERAKGEYKQDRVVAAPQDQAKTKAGVTTEEVPAVNIISQVNNQKDVTSSGKRGRNR
jgi:hypothetical protein